MNDQVSHMRKLVGGKASFVEQSLVLCNPPCRSARIALPGFSWIGTHVYIVTNQTPGDPI